MIGFDWYDRHQQARERAVCEAGRVSASERVRDLPGYVSEYAACGGNEDRAELFRAMIDDARWLDTRARQDPILAEKVKTLRERLAAVDPAFDAAFWKRDRALELQERPAPAECDEVP